MPSVIKRNQSIDLIKILAMLGVMSLHSNLGRTDIPTAFILSRLAGISIPLFFMTSGYLMLDRAVDYKYSFYKIYKIVRFVFIIVFTHWLIVGWFTGYSFTDMLKTFIGSFLQRGKFGVFWYFGAMCIIYIMLPLLQKLNNHKNLIPIILGLLGSICFIFFSCDAELSLEKTTIPQTLRIWYWLFYFILGGSIKVWNVSSKIHICIVLIHALIFLSFVYWFRFKISGIEYFFGSFLCMMYALFVFLFIIGRDVKNNVITVLSNIFLPCYALHMSVIGFTRKFVDTVSLGVFSPIADFFLVVILTMGISLLIMNIPIVKNIFKI